MGSVVIYVEFPTWHWHFDPMFKATVVMTYAMMRVYIFHDHHFGASVMSSFFSPHDPFVDITMFAVYPHFHPLMCLWDAKIDSNMHLTPTYPIEPSYSSVIQLT